MLDWRENNNNHFWWNTRVDRTRNYLGRLSRHMFGIGKMRRVKEECEKRSWNTVSIMNINIYS